MYADNVLVIGTGDRNQRTGDKGDKGTGEQENRPGDTRQGDKETRGTGEQENKRIDRGTRGQEDRRTGGRTLRLGSGGIWVPWVLSLPL